MDRRSGAFGEETRPVRRSRRQGEGERVGNVPCALRRYMLRSLNILTPVLLAFGALPAAAETRTYDLCVLGQATALTQTVWLQLVVNGADPGDSIEIVAAALARRILWGGKAQEVYAERFDPALCAAAREHREIRVELTAEDLDALQNVRGPDDNEELFAQIAKRAIGIASPPSPDPKPAPEGVLLRLYFATNRKDTGSADKTRRFGNERSRGLTFGAVSVSIPRDHRMGELESPSILKLEFRKDPKRHVTLEAIEELSKAGWRDELRTRATRMGKPGVLVFVHGYNVAFDEAAERSAQLAYDLSFPGPTVFFAWPAQGKAAQYVVDAQMAEYSVADMKDVLRDLAALVPGGPVYVIAHSMGNQVLARGFAELMAIDPGKRRSFKEIVLAAPDIDADVFKRDIAPKFLVPGPRFTLYANSKDRALEASEGLHGPGSRRLGQGGDQITILSDIDSIDATRIKTDFFAHSYFGDSETLLSDLFYLIRQHLPPDARVRLEPVVRPAGKYWRFRP